MAEDDPSRRTASFLFLAIFMVGLVVVGIAVLHLVLWALGWLARAAGFLILAVLVYYACRSMTRKS